MVTQFSLVTYENIPSHLSIKGLDCVNLQKLLVWRLLRNQLPTKDNLVQRGILNPIDDMS